MASLRVNACTARECSTAIIDELEQDWKQDGAPSLLSISEAAKLLGKHRHSLWRDVQCERLRGLRASENAEWRIRLRDLAIYVVGFDSSG